MSISDRIYGWAMACIPAGAAVVIAAIAVAHGMQVYDIGLKYGTDLAVTGWMLFGVAVGFACIMAIVAAAFIRDLFPSTPRKPSRSEWDWLAGVFSETFTGRPSVAVRPNHPPNETRHQR